jgi:hypothetical protein
MSQFFTVNQGASQTGLTFNATSPQSYNNPIIPTCSNLSGTGTSILQMNGTTITSGTTLNLGASYYFFNCSLTQSANYSYSENLSYFTISKSSEKFNVLFNTSSVNYPTTFLVWANSTTPFVLKRNGTTIVNNTEQVGLAAGTYNFSAQRNDTANYTYNYNDIFFTVNKNLENCQVLFNETSPLGYPKTFLVWANCTTPFVLARNGTTIVNNSVQSLSIGAYNFSILRNDSSNYTSYYDEVLMSIADVTPPTFTEISQNASLFYGNESLLVQFVGTDETAFDSYSINDTTNFNINSSGFLLNKTFLAVGNYEINVTINDTSNNINWTIFNLIVKEIPVVESNSTSPAKGSGGGGGGGSSNRVVLAASQTNQTNQSNQTIQPSQATSSINSNENKSSNPSKLFDIKLELDSATIKNSSALSSVATFTSFGSVPTAVDLTYVILNSSGEEVYREKGNVTVTTEQVVRKNFENLSLSGGRYTLVLTTVYNDNVKDEFRQEFTVESKSSGFGIYLLIGIICLLLIGTLIIIYSRHRMHLRYKNNEKTKSGY